MATYYETARTNYFKVKDRKLFDEFIAQFPTIEVVENDTLEDWVCLIFGENGVPNTLGDEDDDDAEEIDLLQEVAMNHLEDDFVLIAMGAGSEENRYVSGWSFAMNNKGLSQKINLSDIYLSLDKLGKHHTLAEY
jgi:hypothetical protein